MNFFIYNINFLKIYKIPLKMLFLSSFITIGLLIYYLLFLDLGLKNFQTNFHILIYDMATFYEIILMIITI
jgi:hypothetical protein